MSGALSRKIFGSSNDVRGSKPRVDAINALEAELEKLPDDALRARTESFRTAVAEGKSLDDQLVPREAAKRVATSTGYTPDGSAAHLARLRRKDPGK